MALEIIQIPTLRDKPQDFEQLFDIWTKVDGCCKDGRDIRFEFSRCSNLRPNAIAFIGGLARLIESYSRQKEFDWNSIGNPEVLSTIHQNGFTNAFGYPSRAAQVLNGNSIPYREDKIQDVSGIMDYLEQNWLGRGWVQVSQRLRDAIVGRMWEIYNNAFEHSNSEIGVFTCGQHFLDESGTGDETLVLCVTDFGKGIPNKVRNFFSEQTDDPMVTKLTGASCLQWAFQGGNTTKTGEPAGSGLDLLKEFVKINKGRLEIYSNDGYAIVDKDGERFKTRDRSFWGTVVNITLLCDENLYQFVGESK